MKIPAFDEVIQFAPTSTIGFFDERGVGYGFVGRVGRAPRDLHRPKQVHKIGIIEASAASKGIDIPARPEGDGIYTKEKALKVGVVTADCLPVLLVDTNATQAMAVHAGWRGLTAGILAAAVKHFEAHTIGARDLLVAIGPAISGVNYEVGPEVVEQISAPLLGLKNDQLKFVVEARANNKSLVHLSYAAIFNFLNLGVQAQHMAVMPSCTFGDSGLWFSYRREGAGAGRNYSWISLA
jgi:YfiH family protein